MDLKPENIELGNKIMAGIQLAIDRLIETSAANNQSLVMYENGEIKHIPAKELLARNKKTKP